MFGAGGDDNGEAVGLAQSRVEDNIVVHILSIVVTHNPQETDLVVDYEQSGIVPIDAFKLVCRDWVDTGDWSVTLHERYKHRGS